MNSKMKAPKDAGGCSPSYAARSEQSGLAGHWSYDLNRHLGLLSAYRGEFTLLEPAEQAAQPNCTRRDNGRAGG